MAAARAQVAAVGEAASTPPVTPPVTPPMDKLPGAKTTPLHPKTAREHYREHAYFTILLWAAVAAVAHLLPACFFALSLLHSPHVTKRRTSAHRDGRGGYAFALLMAPLMLVPGCAAASAPLTPSPSLPPPPSPLSPPGVPAKEAKCIGFPNGDDW